MHAKPKFRSLSRTLMSPNVQYLPTSYLHICPHTYKPAEAWIQEKDEILVSGQRSIIIEAFNFSLFTRLHVSTTQNKIKQTLSLKCVFLISNITHELRLIAWICQ